MELVIEGCEWDATRSRYATWDELAAYCHRVASAVGLMCIEIFGYASPRARDYAMNLGLALQLTNILRDVAEDAARGRIYLPLEDLAAFGVSERDILDGKRTPELVRLLRFEARRAHGLYLRGRAAIGEEEKDRLVVAEIMGDIYFQLLMDLEERDFPMERATLSTGRKAAVALRRFALARLRRAGAMARAVS
jgi:phytoene synthase